MKMFKRGEKGFTLIELLIVVAILGVLAAIVIPNVGRFIGSADDEAMATELSTVQAAVQAMMVTNSISNFNTSGIATANTTGNHTNDMTIFPSASDPYMMYGATGGNYLGSDTTQYYYYVDADGTVHQDQS